MKIQIKLIMFLILIGSSTNKQSNEQENSIGKESLKDHIQFLASADLKGRKTNEPGYLKAADYVAAFCKEIELLPYFKASSAISHDGYYQQVPFVNIKMGNDNWLSFTDGKKFYPEKGYFLMNSGSAVGVISIDSIVFAGYALHEPDLDWDDFAGMNVRGKYVMMVDGFPHEDKFPELNKKHEQSHISLSLKIEKLYKLGAKVLIIVSDASRKFWKLSAKINEKLGYKPIHPSFWADPYHAELPVIMIHPDIFKTYFPEVNIDINKDNYPGVYGFKSKIQLSVDIDQRIFSAPNVAGFIQGSDSTFSDEVIILSAHLDHIGTEGNEIFYGANDNASSCSVLLEIAKELVKNPPKRTVIFIFYTAEEPCLWGSQYFISNYNYAKENIVVNINVEMCGKRDKGNNGITAIGPVAFDRYFNKIGPLSVRFLDLEENKQSYSGSDQLSFYRNNIPAIRFGNLDYPEKHTSQDDISIIDFDYLSNVAKTLLWVTKEISNN